MEEGYDLQQQEVQKFGEFDTECWGASPALFSVTKQQGVVRQSSAGQVLMLADRPGFGEIASAPANTLVSQPISTLSFSSTHEVLWAGTQAGYISILQSPALVPYCRFRVHSQQVNDTLTLGEGIVSVSGSTLRFHQLGGATQATVHDQKGGEMVACALEPGGSNRVVVGQDSSTITVYDLAAQSATSRVSVAFEPVVVGAPAGRGAVAVATAAGEVALMDPRTGYRVEATLQAHAAGMAAMDVRGDSLATAGFGVRMGQVTPDAFVKVFDVRAMARMVGSVPFPGGAAMLRFHPSFSATLLIASAAGRFSLADTQGVSYNQTYQVETEGDALVVAAISPSGEVLAFGGSGGYLHLWSASPEPRVNRFSQALEAPPAVVQPAVALQEADSFAAAPQHVCYEGALLSEYDPNSVLEVGLPPRVIDASLLTGLKQVDFVGYIQNPKFWRGQPQGEAAKAVSALRNTRHKPQPDPSDSALVKAERAKQRAAAGGVVLPPSYHSMQIKQQTGTKFEEFDFGFHNRTRFAGLENGIANCYTNSLWQVLYFIPAMRDGMLRHGAEAEKEFCLTCEMGFLFRMLATAHGAACQASNLVRALRQNREAAGLGLLEGQAQASSGAQDLEVNVGRDRSLPRRVQSLSRFLLEQLHREAGAASPPTPPPLQAAEQDAAGGATNASGASADPASSVVENIFGMRVRQQMQCLSGDKAQRVQETRSFQVDLRYPPAKERPASSASSTPASSPSKPSLQPPAAAAAASAAARPSFSSLLSTSLQSTADMRAWFDEQHGYQYIRQTRVPLTLPQVLVINCGLQDRADLCWWQPVAAAASAGTGQQQGGERAWLPLAIRVETRPDQFEVRVTEASSTAELQADAVAGPGASAALYELTALIAHIHDEDELQDGDADGHLVAHVKLLASYLDAQRGMLQSPPQPSPGQAPLPRRAAALAAKLAAPEASAQQGSGDIAGAGLVQVSRLDQPTVGQGMKAHSATAGVEGTTDYGTAGELRSAAQAQLAQDVQMLTLAAAAAEQPVGRAASLPAAGPDWLLCNDFSIVATPAEEAVAMYGAQKVPCLLYYTQVRMLQEEAEAPLLEPPPTLPSHDAFLQLCSSPPLQGAGARLEAAPYRLLQEAPAPGMMLGIDAEFVALAPAEKAMQREVEVEVRPMRLGLARVSVVVGEGPLAMQPCIDDYIRTLEPVHDYLTKFSGLAPGDLDPVASRHYLTTLKRAYMKLRYLVDAGAVFVGHGLKKDFRMINIVVPPEQVVDTVDLFSFKRQRKLSLRFLASYLLRTNIQQHTHDSIEDARTALKLYQVYRQLVEEEKFQEKLLEMYSWGKQWGWEPVVWRDGQPQPAA